MGPSRCRADRPAQKDLVTGVRAFDSPEVLPGKHPQPVLLAAESDYMKWSRYTALPSFYLYKRPLPADGGGTGPSSRREDYARAIPRMTLQHCLGGHLFRKISTSERKAGSSRRGWQQL
jgi:hypothetical protein